MKIIKYLLILGVACIISVSSFSIESGFIGPLEEAACFEEAFEFENETFCEEDDSLKHFTAPINIDTGFVDQNDNYPLPSIVEENITYDPATNQYIITQTIGNHFFSNPRYLTLSEYLEYELEQNNNNFWNNQNNTGGRSGSSSGIGNSLGNLLNTDNLIPELYTGSELFDRLFGDNTVSIKPQGDVNLTFGGNWSRTDNPNIRINQQRNSNFDFNMDINMNMVGQIGDKMKLDFDYNTLSNFDFDNQIKLEYAGTEDEIVQKIEAGNVSLPLPTLLIPGAQNLFGIKSELKFGRLTVTSIASQQKSELRTLTIKGGAQIQDFEVKADEYEENQHFFLGDEFRKNFNKSLASLPYINSPFDVNKLEVWVTNDQGDVQDIRNVVALMDLGEVKPYNEDHIKPDPEGDNYPALDNYTNDLYKRIGGGSNSRSLNQVADRLSDIRLIEGTDFITTFARKLEPSEYTLNRQLGFISLNIRLQPDQIVGVSYQYQNNSIPSSVYQVGEFAQDIPRDRDQPNVIFIKLLKTITQDHELPIWDLMMKNIYSLGAYQVEKEDFKLDVYYQDPGSGQKRYLPTEDEFANSQPIIKLVNLDNLNANNERDICEKPLGSGNYVLLGDGIFDYVEGLTMNSQRGRLMFPVLEPFGESLKKQFKDDGEAEKFAFDELYETTKTRALQNPEKNRFLIRGTYKSKFSSNIRLNAFNLPRGSVRVTQGGRVLIEDVDYTINYSLGTIQLLNDAYLQSGQPIQISYENPELFGFNLKSMYGTRLDYWISDDFTLGGTFMHLAERPFTQKVNYGDDPIANSMMGLDMNYFSEAPGITRFIDKLPFINTKEKSTVSFRAEAARFAPGHSRAITRDGQVFIDDFEGSTTFNDITFPFTAWSLASTPKGATDKNGKILFKEAEDIDTLSYGYNRANINWYQLEYASFCGSGANTLTGYESTGQCSNNENRNINYREIFPDRQIPRGQLTQLFTFDLSYYPSERGPYNYTTTGLDVDGSLTNPEDRWGGIMRALNRTSSTDFEASNTEFIEFWMMDPLTNDNPGNSGSLYINLGEISEDILKDSNNFGEHAIDLNENSPTIESEWGVIPLNQISPSFALSTNEAERRRQDVGLDGLNDEGEREHFADYLAEIEASPLSIDVKEAIRADPSNDNYNHFRDVEVQDTTRILNTYKRFNNPEGNSPFNDGNDRDDLRTYFQDSDREDLNDDNTLNRAESYFEYRIDLKADMMPGDIPYLYNVNDMDSVRWLNFKIPVEQYTNKVGSISDFRAVRFVRMFLTGFKEPVTCRFEGIDLVRNQWRRYQGSLKDPGEIKITDSENALFNVTAVGVEEHSGRQPVPYVLPPNVVREQVLNTVGGGGNIAQNEQSMALQVCGLEDGDAKAVFKTLDYDFREFRRIKMLLHAHEDVISTNRVDDGDVTAFIRIGSDFTENYYEYEIPLKISNLDSVQIPIPEASTDPAFPVDTTGRIDLLRQRAQTIWQEANDVNVAFDTLIRVKRNRNIANWSFTSRYTEKRFERISARGDSLFRNISVVGSPDFGRVKTIMLGVRNPESGSKFNPLYNARTKKSDDDAEAKCVEVWFNELAVSDFDESDGYAAVASLDVKLADLGNLVLSGNMHTDGFGTLEQKVNERFKDTRYEYDGALNLELGRFFPKESGIRIPFRADYSKSISDPEFDPYETDIRFDDSVEDEGTKTAAEAIKQINPDIEDALLLNPSTQKLVLDTLDVDAATKQAIEENSDKASKQYRKDGRTVSEIKSINFVGVKKVRTNNERKQRIYDIANWSATYAYTEENYRDPYIEMENSKEHYGSLDYTYSTSPKFITPFKKLIKSDSKWLSLIKDFNFNPIPNSINFRTDARRLFEETKLRDLDEEVNTLPLFNKAFVWGRSYGFNHKLAKSLTIDYNASNSAEIDEPKGRIDTQEKKDSIRSSIRNLGRNIDFRQGLNVNYKLPFDKLPITDWIDAKIQYGTTFDWQVGPLFNVDTIQLGNFINNSQNVTLNGNLKLRNLYNKSAFLKQYDTSGRRNAGAKRPKKKKKNKGEEDSELPEVPEKVTLGSNKAVGAIVKLLTSVKQVSLTYRDTRNTSLPGFMHSPQYVGNNWENNAPGLDFSTFGRQPFLEEWLPGIAQQGWITDDHNLNEPVLQTQNQKIDLKATVEPFNDFKIELTATMSYSLNHSEWYKKLEGQDDFQSINPLDMGNYSASYIPTRTLFKGIRRFNPSPADSIDSGVGRFFWKIGDFFRPVFGVPDPESINENENFTNFEENRVIIANRLDALSAENGIRPLGSEFKPLLDTTATNIEDYFEGYGPYSQEVLIPAFMAAYTNTDPSKVRLSPLRYIPLPNWRITYNGLTKLGKLKEKITNLSIRHGYSSNYSVNSFQSDPSFFSDPDELGEVKSQNVFFNNGTFLRDRFQRSYGFGRRIDTLSGNYYSLYDIPAIVVQESFTPLIGIDLTLKNGLTANMDYKVSRNLALSFIDYQLLETHSKALTFGLGYRFQDLNIPIRFMGNNFELKNDLSFIFDFTYRNDITINYILDQQNTEPTQGAISYQISPRLEYTVNDRLRASLFYDRRFTDPHIPDGFRNINTQAGLQLTFSLAE